MAYFNPGLETLVLETVVSGTHSAGKTTVIEGFNDPELGHICDITDPYGVSLIELPPDSTASDSSARLVPVLTVAEAAVRYARLKGNMALLGNQYSFKVQREIEFLAAGNYAFARNALHKCLKSLKSNPDYADRLSGLAVILGDRSSIDGEVYSKLRTPDDDDDTMGGFPFRDIIRDHARVHLDVVFICDPADVPFDKTIERASDSLLRDQVHEDITRVYGQLIGNPLIDLTGSPQERREQIIGIIGLVGGGIDFNIRLPIALLSDQSRNFNYGETSSNKAAERE